MPHRFGLFRWQSIFKITLLICLIVAGNYVTHAVTRALNFDIRPSNEDAVHNTILIASILYSALLAIPFVPGAEIGLALIAMLGPPIAVLVYLSTVAGLTISFLAGRVVPLAKLISFVELLGLVRTTVFLKSIEPLSGQQRLEVLIDKAPTRFLPFLLKHRYISLAVALNLPGNFIIGGGGGIALFAGISRLFSVPAFLVTVALAVSPVPLAVFLLGKEVLPS
jgi:uncharacterized membrane protein YdjX (TVP38/TMEM64 family)